MTGVEFADSALEALREADACVIVTEWPEFAELDWVQLGERMPGRLVVDGRNFLDPDAVRAAGLRLRGNRALSAPTMRPYHVRGGRAGADPGRRRGDAAASADLDHAQTGGPAGGPPVHRLHARVAARPRRRRGDPVLRLHGRRRPGGPGRRRRDGRQPALRRGAPAAGHRRRAEVRRGPAAGPLLHAQRRRPHRHRPDRPAAPARADRGARHAGADPGGGPLGLRPGPPRRRRWR